MKGKIFMGLFSLPFAAVGVWMIWMISGEVLDAWDMRSWYPVPAQVMTAGTTQNSGDDSTTYEAYAKYRYSYNARQYVGTRVTIAEGADNIGSYQTEMGARLSAAWRSEEPITVYVNPDDPTESIVDPKLRWGLLAFKSVFGLVFGGIGFGLLIATIVTRAPKEEEIAQFSGTPWLLNDDWQTETIKSGSRAAMIGAWVFAGFWNLISAPLPFLLYEEVTRKENYAALIGLVFTVVGIGLLIWAIRRTMEWTRFGPAPLKLDPFPGSIGGHVGGTIDLSIPYDSNAKFQLTLSSIHSYVSGSGKNRSRKEKASWQDRLVAHAEPGGKGTRLTFRFDVPKALQESDARQEGDSYDLWRLNLKAEIDGPDIDRDYEIPVYATGAQSRHISERAVQQSRAEQGKLDDAAVVSSVKIVRGVSGTSLYYPVFRHLWSGVIGLFFGAAFGGAGVFVILEEGARIFGGVFVLIGGLIGLISLYTVLNSLEVTQDGMSIRTIRRLLGIPVKRREMRRDAFYRFEKSSSMQTQSGNKHVMLYKVNAVDNLGNNMVIGEGFKGENEARAAIRLFERELGLRARDRDSSRRDEAAGDYDVLAADS